MIAILFAMTALAAEKPRSSREILAESISSTKADRCASYLEDTKDDGRTELTYFADCAGHEVASECDSMTVFEMLKKMEAKMPPEMLSFKCAKTGDIVTVSWLPPAKGGKK